MATTLASNIDLGPITKVRRTWRITINAPTQQPITVDAHREELLHDADGALIKQDTNPAHATLAFTIDAAVAAETVTLADGTVLSVAQLAEGVERYIEARDAAVLNPPAPEPDPEPDPEE